MIKLTLCVIGLYLGLRLIVAGLLALLHRLINANAARQLGLPLNLLAVVLALRLSVAAVPQAAVSAGLRLALGELLFVSVGWVALRALTIGLYSVYFARIKRTPLPSAVQTLVTGILYLAAFLAALHVRYGYALGDLVITTSVVALVTGIAFQTTLASVLSGLTISLDRPFEPGDFVRIGDVEGLVAPPPVQWTPS